MIAVELNQPFRFLYITVDQEIAAKKHKECKKVPFFCVSQDRILLAVRGHSIDVLQTSLYPLRVLLLWLHSKLRIRWHMCRRCLGTLTIKSS